MRAEFGQVSWSRGSGRCRVPPSRHSRAAAAVRPAFRVARKWAVPLVPRTGSNHGGRDQRPSKQMNALGCGRITASAAATVESPTAASAAQPEQSEVFQWTKYWWPLIPVEYLDPKRPKAMTIMGVQVAVWRDGEGQWRVFKDACPHRLAPLSEGRVEADGTLLCSYHAWRFNGEGKCTSIPQSISPEAEATATASKRSCATAFPTKEHVGLLWVWPDESATRWIDSAAAPLVAHQGLENDYSRDPKEVVWFMRDVPYGYEILTENLTDPAHFPVSHHALFPVANRYRLNRMAFEPDKEDPSGKPWTPAAVPPTAAFRHTSAFGSNTIERAVRIFAPSLLLLTGTGNSPETDIITSMCVPVQPGRARLIYCDTFHPRKLLPPVRHLGDKLRNSALQFVINLAFTPMSRHLTMLRLLDGDGVFLNIQETILQQQYKGDWKKAYYLPTPSDGAVVAMRTWIQKAGRPFAQLENQTASVGLIDRKVLLDRYSQHTAHCPTCQKEVKRLEGLITLAKAAAAVCLLVACAVAGSVGWTGLAQGSFPFLTKAGAVVVLLAGVAAWAATEAVAKLQAARQEFFFVDYVHADKH